MLAPLFRQHLWANLTLLDFCMTLTDEQLDAVTPGIYGSIRATWVHIIEERFVQAATTGTLPPVRPEDTSPPLSEVRERLARTGAQALELALAMDEDRRIKGEFRGQPFDMPAYIPLIQVIQHGAEHRTNITTALAIMGLTPPGTDAWSYWQAEGL